MDSQSQAKKPNWRDAALLWRVAFLVLFGVLSIWGHWTQIVAVLVASLSFLSAFLLSRRAGFARILLYILTTYYVCAGVSYGIYGYFNNPTLRQQPIVTQVISWLVPIIVAVLLLECCSYARFPPSDDPRAAAPRARAKRTSEYIGRIAGGVLLTFGAGLTVLEFWIVERQITLRGSLQLSAAVMVAGFALLMVFCFAVGYRLLLSRPNRYGSILSPVGWTVLALCFVASALLSVVYGSQQRGSLWFSAVCTILLSCASLFSAWRVSRSRRLTLVFSPETALLRRKGFTPPGFVCGVEILNDDLTPMAFVVSVLQSGIGLSETDAVRTMLDIHRKGGVLLPMPSFDESKRVAELITDQARSNNHPLVCRAVQVE